MKDYFRMRHCPSAPSPTPRTSQSLTPVPAPYPTLKEGGRGGGVSRLGASISLHLPQLTSPITLSTLRAMQLPDICSISSSVEVKRVWCDSTKPAGEMLCVSVMHRVDVAVSLSVPSILQSNFVITLVYLSVCLLICSLF